MWGRAFHCVVCMTLIVTTWWLDCNVSAIHCVPFTTNVTQMGWQEVNYLSLPDSSSSLPFLALNKKTNRKWRWCIIMKRLNSIVFVFIGIFNIVSSFFFFFQSKRKFERECREAEKSQITYDRLDNDINATKSEVEKVGSSRLQQQLPLMYCTCFICEPAYPFFSHQWK